MPTTSVSRGKFAADAIVGRQNATKDIKDNNLMDDVFKQQIIQKARRYWDNEQPFQAGGVIFECIPVEKRHVWAYEILKFAYSLYPQSRIIDAVLEFAQHPEKWSEGKNNLREAHRIVDDANRYYDDPILGLATQAGKIVYTAQQFPAPFDHSAGWKIAEYLKEIIRQKNSSELEEIAWARLADPDFIVLNKPVMCHPACPTCLENGLTPTNGT